jgi:predicted lipid-binding transport protein (Tim44 family)
VSAAVLVDLGGRTAVVGALPSRAGGGNTSNRGVSGSRSSGSRSSGSSGGVGSAIGGLICLVIVVVIVLALVLVARRGKGKGGPGAPSGQGFLADDTPPPPPPPPLPRRPEVDATLAALKERDPGFDEQGFLNGVSTSFTLVQKAWCDRQPSESRKVMADGIWVRHKQQIDEQLAAHRHNVLEDLHIGRSEIIDAATDADSDSITVRLHAYSRDYDVDDASGQIVRGDRVVRLWTEDWTITRSSTAVTKAGQETRQQCPNCGAPLNLDDTGTCAYCKEMVMAGKYDWVLSRIEQVYDQ